MEIDLKNNPLQIFFNFSTYSNQINWYPTQILNPFNLALNNINNYLTNLPIAANVNKEVILKKGSVIEFFILSGGYLYDYPPHELYIYSSASETYDISGKRNNIVGSMTLIPAIQPSSSLGGGNSYWYVFVSPFENRYRFIVNEDISLGRTCDNLFIGILVRTCPTFKIPPIIAPRTKYYNFLGEKYRDNFYWLNFTHGINYPKTVDSVVYDEASDIIINFKFEII